MSNEGISIDFQSVFRGGELQCDIIHLSPPSDNGVHLLLETGKFQYMFLHPFHVREQ